MKLSEALSRMSGAVEKTASAPAPAPVAATTSSNDVTERLKIALKEATAVDTSKTASAASPVEDLTKIAADLSRAEHDALVKEAQLYGAAVCDGFMARAAQYNEAAAKLAAEQPKVASTETIDKVAATQAAQSGYDSTVAQLEKLANAAYDRGYNDTVREIHKVACDMFVAGFRDTLSLIEASR